MKKEGPQGRKKKALKRKALLILCQGFGYKEEDKWHGYCQACGRKDLPTTHLDPMHKVAAGSKWRMAQSAFVRAEAEAPENICAGCRPCHTVIDDTPELRKAMEASSANVINGEKILWTMNQWTTLMTSPKRPKWM